MSNLVEDLRSFFLSFVDLTNLIGDRVHYLHPPQGYQGGYLYYARVGSGDDADRCLDDQPGADYDFRELIDLEGIDRDDEVAEQIALQLRKLDSWQRWDGPIGNGTAQVIFVRDHVDEYEPAGVAGDAGLTVAALRLEIVGYQPGS